jgi:hypothetical protein
VTFHSCGAYSAGQSRLSTHDYHDFVALQNDVSSRNFFSVVCSYGFQLGVVRSLESSLAKMASDGKWPDYYIPHAMRLPLCPPYPENEHEFRLALFWQLTRMERPLDLGLYEAVPLAAVKDDDHRMFSSLQTTARALSQRYGLLYTTAVFLNNSSCMPLIVSEIFIFLAGGVGSSHTLVFGLHPETGSALGFGVYTGT